MSGDRLPSGRGLDPTKMKNQPALRSSSGRIWIIFGGLFGAIAVALFGLLVFSPEGTSGGVAVAAIGVIVALYVALVVVRFSVRERKVRLRFMAACLLSMAGVALIGMLVCMMIEWAP